MLFPSRITSVSVSETGNDVSPPFLDVSGNLGFWKFLCTFILELCGQDFFAHVQIQSSHLEDELLMLWGLILKRFPHEKLCDACFTIAIVLLLLISQVLSLLQCAIFKNIIHMLKFNMVSEICM